MKIEIYAGSYQDYHGNTYFYMFVFVNDELRYQTPTRYGYDNHFLEVARNELIKSGDIDETNDLLTMYCLDNDIELVYDMTHYNKKKDRDNAYVTMRDRYASEIWMVETFVTKNLKTRPTARRFLPRWHVENEFLPKKIEQLLDADYSIETDYQDNSEILIIAENDNLEKSYKIEVKKYNPRK